MLTSPDARAVLNARQQWRVTISILLLLLLVYVLLSPLLISAAIGLGGYISEKVLGDGTNENLWLGDGTNEPMVLGSGPSISTSSVTGNAAEAAGALASATFNGTLSSFNGMPNADVWFEWGYSDAALTNSTATVNTATTGTKSAAVTGLTSGATVYYRMVSSTDGTSYGSIVQFIAAGAGSGGWLLRALLPLIVAASVILGAIRGIGFGLLGLATGGILGIIAFAVVREIVRIF